MQYAFCNKSVSVAKLALTNGSTMVVHFSDTEVVVGSSPTHSTPPLAQRINMVCRPRCDGLGLA